MTAPVYRAAITLFVSFLGYGIVVPLLPELVTDRSVTEGWAYSLIFIAYPVAKVVAQVPGVLVDRVGAKPILIGSTAALAACLVGFIYVSDVWGLVAIRVVEGAATGFVHPAVFSHSLAYADEKERGRVLGIIGGIGTSGVVAGPAIAGALAPLGARFAISIAAAATVAVTLMNIVQRSPHQPERPAVRSLHGEWAQISGLVRSLVFVGIILPVGFNKVTHSAFLGLLPLYGNDAFGLETRGITMLFVIAGVGFAVAQPLGGVLADRIGSIRAVRWAIPLQLCALASMTLATGLPAFAIAFALYVLVASVIYTATLKHAADRFASGDGRGVVFGVLATVTDACQLLGPLLFLNLYPFWGHWVFLAMAALGVPFALTHALLVRKPIG